MVNHSAGTAMLENYRKEVDFEQLLHNEQLKIDSIQTPNTSENLITLKTSLETLLNHRYLNKNEISGMTNRSLDSYDLLDDLAKSTIDSINKLMLRSRGSENVEKSTKVLEDNVNAEPSQHHDDKSQVESQLQDNFNAEPSQHHDDKSKVESQLQEVSTALELSVSEVAVDSVRVEIVSSEPLVEDPKTPLVPQEIAGAVKYDTLVETIEPLATKTEREEKKQASPGKFYTESQPAPIKNVRNNSIDIDDILPQEAPASRTPSNAKALKLMGIKDMNFDINSPKSAYPASSSPMSPMTLSPSNRISKLFWVSSSKKQRPVSVEDIRKTLSAPIIPSQSNLKMNQSKLDGSLQSFLFSDIDPPVATGTMYMIGNPSWQTRYLVLARKAGKLYYFNSSEPQENPLGWIPINAFTKVTGVDDDTSSTKKRFMIEISIQVPVMGSDIQNGQVIKTKESVWKLMTESRYDQKSWIGALSNVIMLSRSQVSDNRRKS